MIETAEDMFLPQRNELRQFMKNTRGNSHDTGYRNKKKVFLVNQQGFCGNHIHRRCALFSTLRAPCASYMVAPVSHHFGMPIDACFYASGAWT